ncbi:translation initiation factor eIF2B subunit beta-like isoform X2 [Artemia franciscana]
MLDLSPLEKLVDAIQNGKWKTAEDLIKLLVEQPTGRSDLSEENFKRRIIKIIKDEYMDCKKKTSREKVTFALLSGHQEEYNEEIPELRDRLIEASQIFTDELCHGEETISNKASDFIKTGETILTYGCSSYVKRFLLKAAETQKFTVVYVSSGSKSLDSEMVKAFSSRQSLRVVVIPHSNVFAMMPRVTTIVVEPQAVYANGGFMAVSGMHVIALAALHYSKTFLVCGPTTKYSPKYGTARDEAFDKIQPADDMLPSIDKNLLGQAYALNSLYDYVPPELVTLFITETGDHPPGYCYRIVREIYGTEEDI